MRRITEPLRKVVIDHSNQLEPKAWAPVKEEIVEIREALKLNIGGDGHAS